VVHRGAAISRLKKVDVERLLADYDADPIAELTVALRIILGMPAADWSVLLAAAPIDADRRQRLLSADEASLDQLAAELNERRCFDEPRGNTPVSRRAADDGSARSTDIRHR
jgi:hypothetical protein